MAQDLEQAPQQATQHDDMPLMGIDHVEYYVGNARQAAVISAVAAASTAATPETSIATTTDDDHVRRDADAIAAFRSEALRR